jgi:hypothetical protein
VVLTAGVELEAPGEVHLGKIGSSTFFGDVPEFSDGEPATGPKPEAQMLRFLKGLPRD